METELSCDVRFRNKAPSLPPLFRQLWYHMRHIYLFCCIFYHCSETQHISETLFLLCCRYMLYLAHDVIAVVLGFYVPPTVKVIRRRDLGLKSHSKDWRSPGSNSGPLVYKAGSLTARPRRLLAHDVEATFPFPICWQHIEFFFLKFEC